MRKFTPNECLPPLREGNQAIKSKAGAIKCCKEIKITALPNTPLVIYPPLTLNLVTSL